MTERPRWTRDAPQVLSDMVGEMAQALHDLGYGHRAAHQPRHWTDCRDAYCTAIRMKALTALSGEEDDDETVLEVQAIEVSSRLLPGCEP